MAAEKRMIEEQLEAERRRIAEEKAMAEDEKVKLVSMKLDINPILYPHNAERY